MQLQNAQTGPRLGAMKPFAKIIEERRATRHFRAEPIGDDEIEAMLQMAGQAPSGYNLQPWRFVVVRDAVNRERLSLAAMGQKKVAEASAVFVAFARREHWSDHASEIFLAAAKLGARSSKNVEEQKRAAVAFIEKLSIPVWLNRHVMIAVTYLMLAAESLGWDTAPMEGFDPAAVRAVIRLPDDAEVVALLAVGRHRDLDAPYPGRLPLEDFVYAETFDHAWPAAQASVDASH